MPSQKSLFVSMDGSDDNPGTEEKPLATLERARGAVRELKATWPGPVTIHVGKGTYYLLEPLVLTPEDSGSEAGPITYAARPGEKPVLSRGIDLELSWKPFRDGIFMAQTDLSAEALERADQLFINGRREHRARYPNYDPANPGKQGKGFMPLGAQDGFPPTEVEFYTGERGFNPARRPAHPEEAVLHTRWMLGSLIWQLKGIDYERNVFLLDRGGWHWNTRIFEEADTVQYSPAYLDNVFEELDVPREWYLDKREGILYYMPVPGEDIHAARVEIPQGRQIVEFSGTQADPVHHITFSGFEFTHTTTVYLEEWEALSMGDWTLHRSGAVFFDGAEDCAVRNCFFHDTGGNAVFMNDYCLRCEVTGSTFTRTGESAVCLVGTNLKRLGSNRPFPEHCVVHNNHMHHLGEYGMQIAGVFLACCQKNQVSHNEIHHVPRAAICINDATWGGHVIEHNKLYETCLESVDHGPFNSWGRTRHWCYNQSHGPDSPSHPAGSVTQDALHTTVLRYNYLEDHTVKFGVDMDDGTCNYHVHHNVCIGCPIKFREGDLRIVENNIIIDSLLGIRFDSLYENAQDRFVRNIVFLRQDMHVGEGYGVPPEDARRHFYHAVKNPIESPFMEIDRNLFWSDLGEFRALVTDTSDGKRQGEGLDTQVLSLEEWQERGYDLNSVFADPLFADLVGGDYRLHPDSPAHKLGIDDVVLENCGLLPDFPDCWQD
ncbi:MAG: right-handed parallel beta-helix repeat-containing protein [Planctomycetota bacterium]|jgi:hypothetical protein|nr:right-handed parallel beta-helix repeat-containing protein [Planctomycetota bacterium]